MNKIKLGLADDHTLFRKAMIGMLNEYDDLEVCIEASNGQELLDKLNQGTMCDILILDIEMPVMNGAETVKKLREIYGEKPLVLALSMHKEYFLVQDVLESGANGFVPKEANPEELKLALDSVLSHGFYLNPEISRQVFGNKFNVPDEEHSLSKTEIKIIELICDQKTNKEIAQELNLSPNTINTYRTRILEKINVINTAGLVVYAIRNGYFIIK
ncbi:MAG: response regulator transcription factor [Bacteroidia bacterium]